MRIVAGRLGGRRIEAPSGRDTRPTSERVREAVFSVLGAEVVGAVVADLFAGTGALGFEALSRGAERVDFFESGRHGIAALRRNIAALGAGRDARVVTAPLPRGLGGGPWSLVFVDPPWGRGLGEAAVDRLLAAGLLAPEGLVVFEERARSLPDPARWASAGLREVDRRRYGDTEVAMLRLEGSRDDRAAPREGESVTAARPIGEDDAGEPVDEASGPRPR